MSLIIEKLSIKRIIILWSLIPMKAQKTKLNNFDPKKLIIQKLKIGKM